MARCSVVLVVGALAAVGVLSAFAQVDADRTSAPSTGLVVICPIKGLIDDSIAVLVERAVEKSAQADALIFIVDTPGGRVDSALKIVNDIVGAPCRTIAFIDGMGAISAGAIISFACKDMVMSPTSNIGTAQPVILTPEGVLPTGEKEVSFLREKIASLAEYNGHNPAIAKAMVDKDIELRAHQDANGNWVVYEYQPVGGDQSERRGQESARKIIEDATEELPASIKETVRGVAKDILDATQKQAPKITQEEQGEKAEAGTVIVSARGKLLTLTPKNALLYGVIETTAKNVDEVLAFYKYDQYEREDFEMTLAERIFQWLINPTVASLLLLLGVGGLYLEFKAPGISLPGIVGVVCLALFFGARAVLGVGDWIGIMLVVAGIALIAVEMFILPGFGLAGSLGIACLLVGLYLSLVPNGFTIPKYEWDFERLRDAGTTLGITAVLFVIFAIVVWKVMPRTPLYHRLVLEHAQATDHGYIVQTVAESDAAMGLTGVAASMLRPAGRGRFGDRTVRVVTQGEYIEEGTPIVIVEADGNRYVVDRVPSPVGKEKQ